MRLSKVLDVWGSSKFNAVFKAEIEKLGAGQLPLQQALSTGGFAMDDKLNVMIIRTWEEDEKIHIKAGIFYSGVIAGCSCADDPTPLNEIPEYCVLRFDMDKRTAETDVALLKE
jgi:hypothetical protein